MNTKLSKLLAAVLLLGCAGCFSLESSSLSRTDGIETRLPTEEGKPIEHVVVSNYGWYLFNRWPLVCGAAQRDHRLPFTFFSNEVNKDILQSRFMSYASARGCSVSDFVLFNTEEVLMTIGIGGFSLPLPYVITFRDMQYSGVLVKPLTETERERRLTPRQKLNLEMKKMLNKIPNGGAE